MQEVTDPPRKSLLIVEDDPDIVEIVRHGFEREGFRVRVARDGERGLEEALRQPPDVILLDLMLPRLDGLEVCRRLRDNDGTRLTPLLMLTAKIEDADVVVGLEMGADDYVPKPFSPRELVARVRALLRRTARSNLEGERPRLEVAGLVLDATRHEASLDGSLVPLTRAEFRLLWTLVSKPGRVFRRSELVDRITAGESYIIERNVDVHVSSVRRKLGPAGEMIATVRGVGYKCRD